MPNPPDAMCNVQIWTVTVECITPDSLSKKRVSNYSEY